VAQLAKVLNEDKKFRSQRTLVYEGNAILISLLTSIVMLCALWYGGRGMIMGELTSGDVTAYIIYLAMLLRPVSEFVRVCAYFQAGTIGVRSVFSVYEHATPLSEPEEPKTPEVRAGAVAFENVSFHHASGRGGVMHVSFEIQAGQKVLVLGPSSSGKSTLLSLLMRLYDRTSGRIVIDGVDVRDMRRDDVRAYFTAILQDQIAIEDSLLSNVLMDSTEEDPAARIEQTLTLTQQIRLDHKFLSRDKKFGEEIRGEGLGLSRGELQKIALLRAAAKDAPIVLMDDPVSLMDPRSQRQTMELARELFAGKTLFLASHQVPPGFHADWVMILKNGRMEDQGTHPYLLEHSSLYRRLCRHEKSSAQTAT
jgi:ABC-type multidrug transport system fused ATPase/permease subunit